MHGCVVKVTDLKLLTPGRYEFESSHKLRIISCLKMTYGILGNFFVSTNMATSV